MGPRSHPYAKPAAVATPYKPPPDVWYPKYALNAGSWADREANLCLSAVPSAEGPMSSASW